MLLRVIDALGRISIPVHMRRELKLGVGDLVDVDCVGGRISMAPQKPKCQFCGAAKGLSPVKDGYICSDCIDAVAVLKGDDGK